MKYFTLIVVGLMALSLQAQDFDKDKMDKFFSLIEENEQGMGSISIFKDGKEVYQKSIGFADIQHGLNADNETIYRIGSISKTFTASIIMQMVDEQKLTLDTKLSQYFPELPNADKITIEQMLRHRSGLFNFTNKADYLEWAGKPLEKEEILAKVKENGTTFEPNEKVEYSNTNYVLLAYIAEKIDEKSFAKILKKRITQPLRLSRTKYGGKINYKGGEALSYNRTNEWDVFDETDMSIPSGAGAVVSTPTDLNTFYHALMNGKVVSEKSLKQMQTMVDGFGFGLFQFPFYEKKALGHNGGIDGFQSMSGYFEKEKVGISYISNGVVMPVNDIMLGALSIYFGKDYKLPEFVSDVPGSVLNLSSADLDKYIGVYSTASFPLKITITKDGKQLYGQATGQSSFPLKAYDEHKFKFDAAGLKLMFEPENNQMILLQGGVEIKMTKE